MKVLIFGATGMVGQGVLRECLEDKDIERVTAIGRSSMNMQHPKLREVLHADMMNLEGIASQLRDHDACFFCLGVSSVGMNEATYRHLTYDLTLSVARLLARSNPQISFAYVSGAGTDSTEQGRSMWARIKGKTENDLLKLPFSRVFLFRPGVIQPLHQVRSKTRLYQFTYNIIGPMLSTIKRLWPNSLCTSVEVGRAMINAARSEPRSKVLEVVDIVRLARAV
jgi:uncharacterized protein YbjT (DUF2867 family)